MLINKRVGVWYVICKFVVRRLTSRDTVSDGHFLNLDRTIRVETQEIKGH